MKLTYEAKIYPNKRQEAKLSAIIEGCRHLYNQALEDKITIYKDSGKSISRYDLQKAYKGSENYPSLPASVKQMVFYRLERSYSNFFRKSGKFPRFKSYGRYRSFELRTYGIDYRFKDGKLSIYRGIGEMRMRGFRESENYAMGRIVKRANGWFVQYGVEVAEKNPVKIKKKIGIDVGLKSFLTDSDGNHVDSPKFFRKSQRKLSVKQRLLSKAKKGSNRRKKKKQQVAILHEKIAKQRRDWLHKLSKKYAENYDLIAVEDLNIGGMVKNRHLSKSISDASWGMFTNMLGYKMKILGRQMVKVDPKYTSQICSGCGAMVKKSLSVRTHRCPECGLAMDRDENAALNILSKGRECLAARVGCRASLRPADMY